MVETLVSKKLHNLITWHLARLFILCVLILGSVIAHAHPMPNSAVMLRVGETEVKAEIQLPLAELQLAVPYDLSLSSDQLLSKYGRDLQGYILEHFTITSIDGNDWKLEISNINIKEEAGPSNSIYREIVADLVMFPPAESDLRHFMLYYDVIVHQLVTHKILVSVDQDWSNGINSEHQQEIGIIKTDVKSNTVLPLEVNLEAGNRWKGFKAMFAFGMQHIREGLDHILFLLTLLLVAPLIIQDRNWSDFQGFRYTIKRFLTISLAFTLGHSIMLLIGSFDLVPFNVQYIEVFIAISILISSVHCIYPLFAQKESLIAAGFGLIHGLAFSLSISSMGLGWKSKLISILGFNLGIEAMQLIIMLIFFPILLLSKWKIYRVTRLVFASMVVAISLVWIVERLYFPVRFGQ
jgi:hypothetical protein